MKSISTKIKVIGVLFTLLLISIVTTTIYLNEKSQKDATIINIAGKQRMLSQNISKNIFFLYSNPSSSRLELEDSIKEFIYNLNSLKGGNNLSKLKASPTSQIENQLTKVEYLWASFHKNIVTFKNILDSQNYDKELKDIVTLIHDTNTTLLNEIDSLVSLYTIHSEQKISFLRKTQYFFAVLIIFLIIYSFLELKTIENNAKKFIKESKKIMEQDLEQPLEQLKVDGENEIVEATQTINHFINKINSAMQYSTNAIEQSKNASQKLEEITDEFNKVLNQTTNSKDISKQLNKSEDIVIQSQEDLINSNKKLQELNQELSRILKVFDS